MNIGQRLRKFRNEFRYSQGRFAAAIGISQPMISAIESGTARPSDEIKSRIEQAISIITLAEKAASKERERILHSLHETSGESAGTRESQKNQRRPV